MSESESPPKQGEDQRTNMIEDRDSSSSAREKKLRQVKPKEKPNADDSDLKTKDPIAFKELQKIA
jgi:hypothetical protein